MSRIGRCRRPSHLRLPRAGGVLLPGLPGPPERDKRIAPYAQYVTDPFVQPVVRTLHAPRRLIALLALVAVAIASVALARLPQLSA